MLEDNETMAWRISTSKEGAITVPYPLDTVFDAVPPIIADLKWKIDGIDKPLGRFRVKISINFWTWGQTMFIDISKIDENTTKVRVYSEARGQVYDWGKNRRDIERFFHELETTLDTTTRKTIAPTPTGSATTGVLLRKGSNTAALIAFIGGVLGICGLGHMYVGKLRQGLGILFGMIVLEGVALNFIFFGLGLPKWIGLGLIESPIDFGLGLGLFIGYTILWFWQIFNAKSLAKSYNEHVRICGKEPW